MDLWVNLELHGRFQHLACPSIMENHTSGRIMTERFSSVQIEAIIKPEQIQFFAVSKSSYQPDSHSYANDCLEMLSPLQTSNYQ